VRAGHLYEARAFLLESVASSANAELSTVNLTFSLVAAAMLALAEKDPERAAMALGAADGLRRRAGLKAWPSMRRGEADLATRIAQRIGPLDFDHAFAAGSELSHLEAVALVRSDSSRDSGRGTKP
jgi:hypothetical protein